MAKFKLMEEEQWDLFLNFRKTSFHQPKTTLGLIAIDQALQQSNFPMALLAFQLELISMSKTSSQ